MSQSNLSNLTSFDRGIVRISNARDLQKLKLPEVTQFKPSDAKIEARLPKLWKAASLENVMQESFLPKTLERDNLNPSTYQKRLKDAKKAFKKLAEESRKRKKKKKQQYPDEEDEDEIFEQVAQDLEDLEGHQDLLWMLRQVVHLA